MNAVKGFEAVVTRYEKRAHVFQGSVLAGVLRLWLRGCRTPDAAAGALSRG